MPKITEDTKPIMSEEMKKNCKREIGQFGYAGREYENFLYSVQAMKDGNVVKFSNDQLEEYRDKYVKPHEYGIADTFMFDKMSKITSTNEGGHRHETGFFCPRSFWDGVLAMK